METFNTCETCENNGRIHDYCSVCVGKSLYSEKLENRKIPKYTLTDIMTIAARNNVRIEFYYESVLDGYRIRMSSSDPRCCYFIERTIPATLLNSDNAAYVFKDVLLKFNEAVNEQYWQLRRKDYAQHG